LDRPIDRWFVLLVATVATAGSLWFSEGLGLIPCELCWYQRILMYPLVPIAAVALLERRDPRRTVLALAVPGFLVAAYHNYVQMNPAAGSCTSPVPCSTVQYRAFGLTIPQMSLAAFGLIVAAVLVGAALRGRNGTTGGE
jgi:disulfide bond formation protein DsbB